MSGKTRKRKGPRPSGVLTRNQFAQHLINQVRRIHPRTTFSYDREAFAIVSDAGDAYVSQLGLTRFYEIYRDAPGAQRACVLNRALGVAQAVIPAKFSDAASRLLPRVRMRVHYDIKRARAETPESGHQKPCCSPLTDDAAVDVVQDYPEVMLSCDEQVLHRWQITFDKALTQAKENLTERLCDRPWDELGVGVYACQNHDPFNSSRLVLPEQFADLKVQGEPVAMIPLPSILIVTGSEDEDGLGRMAHKNSLLIADSLQRRRPFLSGMAMVLRKSRWQPFLPPQAHPLHHVFSLMAIRTMQRDCAVQAAGLVGVMWGDLAAAPIFEIALNTAGRFVSLSTWPRDTEAFLPQTDMVSFDGASGRGEDSAVPAVPWKRVMKIVGCLMQPTELYPPRFRVTEYPTQRQIEWLMGSAEPVVRVNK